MFGAQQPSKQTEITIWLTAYLQHRKDTVNDIRHITNGTNRSE
jgi:hypothetical protein